MGEVNGAKLTVRALKAEGVEYLFTLSGSVVTVFDAGIDEGIKLIDVRHEQAAGDMAYGWAAVTGKPGVCLVQENGGAANLLPAIAHAYIECMPVVAITNTSASVYLEKSDIFNACQVYRPIVKWATLCTDAPRIPEYVDIAFRKALTGRPGPTLLEIALDTLVDSCDEDLIEVQRYLFPKERNRTMPRMYGDPLLIKKALVMLLNAERPLIIVGDGAGLSGASKELREFVELTKIPAAHWGLGQGLIPDDHPLCMGTGSVLDGAGVLLPEADVILIIGIRLSNFLGFGWPPVFGSDVKVVQVDVEPEEIGKNRPVEIGIVGDAKAVLSQLVQTAKDFSKKPHKESAWIKRIGEEKKKFEDRLINEGSSSARPIMPQRLCKEVREFLPRDTIVVIDGGDMSIWGLTYLRAYFPRHLILSPGIHMEHLGAGVPVAMGAKLACPEKKVLLLTGDGSFLFNGKEIDTARRHDIPIVCVIGNDCAMGMDMHEQIIAYGKERVIATKLSPNTRYDKYAQAFDCYGELVTDPTEIKPALKRAFESGLPAVLDVRTASVETVADMFFAMGFDPTTYER